jgi:hypothetical protein
MRHHKESCPCVFGWMPAELGFNVLSPRQYRIDVDQVVAALSAPTNKDIKDITIGANERPA